MHALMNTSQPDEKVLYRYDDFSWHTAFEKRKFVQKFSILRETEKSYFISSYLGEEKRVPKTGKNIFAWDTEEKALYNYFKRKEKQVKILKEKLEVAEANLAWAKEKWEEQAEYKKNNPTTIILNNLRGPR